MPQLNNESDALLERMIDAVCLDDEQDWMQPGDALADEQDDEEVDDSFFVGLDDDGEFF